ncbi:MAG: hypothetical protein ACX93O_14565, partial [Flagellimonas sp.]
MKTSIVYLIIGLLLINSLKAQVKVGNNPQNLHPASVLELESPTRVLVITRVTDAQMSVINPLPGAMVYNTDQDCLHYYNGTQWINICEALDNSFTVSTRPDYFSTINPAQSKDSTVVISQTENPDGSINYNYEVGLIRGSNIVNTTINASSKLQNNSITSDKLQDNSVSIKDHLNDGDIGVNGQLIRWNGTDWDIIDESSLIVTEVDGDPENELSDLSLTGTLLELTNAETGAIGVDLDNTFATDTELANAITASETADNDTDNTNEYNTGSGIAAGTLSIADGGGTESIDLISIQANNDIVAGSDGALFLDETDDQTATEVSYDNTT